MLHAALSGRRRRKLACNREHSIDARVARDVYLSEDLLGVKVCGGHVGRREKQFGPGVDRCSIFFFWPGQQRIVRPKTGLDMRNRNCSDKSGKGRPKRARGIALNDEKVWWISQQGQQRSGNGADVRVRIRLASAVQLRAIEVCQSEIRWIEVRVLTRKDQRRPEPRSASARATGANLMASGLVPITSLMSARSSLPPSSAGAICPRSEATASG